MKIDTHVHCPTPGAAQTELDSARNLCVHLEKQGIRRAILMSSGEKTPQISLVGLNDQMAEIAGTMPDFYSWMCNMDPVDPETVYDRMAAYQAQGAVGLGELVINRWIDDPMLEAVFSAAEALHLPVTIHMSSEPGFLYGICDRPGLPLLEALLQAHPDLIVVGHSALFWLEISADCPTEGNWERNSYGQGKVVPGGAVERLMDAYPNLYGDLSATSGASAIMRDESYGLAFLEKFQDRLFFATDSYDCEKVFPLGAFLDQCHADGRLSGGAYRKICYENAARLYSLP